MKRVLRFWRRAHGLLRRDRSEDELSAELQSHLDLHIDDNITAGMSPEDARRHAMIALGGMEPTKEGYRDQRRWRFLDELANDLTFAFRLLRKDRGFTVMAAIVLGTGLAVTNTFFTLTHAIVMRGLPIDEAEHVLILRVRDGANRNLGMSLPDYRDVQAAVKCFTATAAYSEAPIAIGDDEHAAERFRGVYVSSNLFELIGERILVGRGFQPQDEHEGEPPVVILGRSVWESRYGGNPAVVGSTVRVNGVAATVIGVVPDRSKFPTNAEVFQPLGSLSGPIDESRGTRTLVMFGRLASHSTLSDAQGELQSLWTDLSRSYPATNANLRLTVRPINEHFVGATTHPAWYAFNAAGLLVLLVACANVANLLVMRGANRRRELAVRTSLGATRGRIVRQLLSEAAVLALVAGVIAIVLATLTLKLMWISIPQGVLSHWMRFEIDLPVFGVLAFVCLGSSLIVGLVPAFQMSKGNLTTSLKCGLRGTGRGLPSRRLTSALLVIQFAVAFGALISISAAARGLDESRAPQIDMHGLLSLSLSLPAERYRTPASRVDLYESMARGFAALKEVGSIALASSLPFGATPTRALVADGNAAMSKGPKPTVRTVDISTAYFQTLGIHLLRGREFTDDDGKDDRPTVIVNQRFVELHFPSSDPLGRQIDLESNMAGAPVERFTIVGVAPTIRQQLLGLPDPVVYFPYRLAAPSRMSAIVRGPADLASTTVALREAMRSLDADVPLYNVMALDRSIKDADWNRRFSNVIANITGLLAVLLSAVGIFALTAHAVVCMTAEIGIRTALGAGARQILWKVLRRAAIQLLLGIIAGVALAMAWARFLSPVSGITAVDFLAGAVALSVVSLVACMAPAIRALRVNPVAALRHE